MKIPLSFLTILFSVKVFAQQPSAQQSTTVLNTTEGVAVTSVSEVEASKMPSFGFLAISVAEMAGDDFRDRNSRAAVKMTNAFGVTYKVTPKSTFGVRQYFTYLNDTDNGNKFEMSNTVLTYAQKISGILGSDEITPLFWYYLPTTEKAQQDHSNGKIRATTYINWTINPKWSFTYILDPRQSFIPSSVGADGTEVFSHTTWIHAGSFSYNFSDTLSVYQGIGTTEDFRSTSFTLLDESLDISTGMYIVIGKVLLIPDITNSVSTRKGGDRPAGRNISSSLYRAEETTYSLSMLANF